MISLFSFLDCRFGGHLRNAYRCGTALLQKIFLRIRRHQLSAADILDLGAENALQDPEGRLSGAVTGIEHTSGAGQLLCHIAKGFFLLRCEGIRLVEMHASDDGLGKSPVFLPEIIQDVEDPGMGASAEEGPVIAFPDDQMLLVAEGIGRVAAVLPFLQDAAGIRFEPGPPDARK